MLAPRNDACDPRGLKAQRKIIATDESRKIDHLKIVITELAICNV